MMTNALSIFLDFDGTITTRDATDAILEAFADPQWLGLEEEWKAGRIGSRECLARQMALVRASRQDVDALLDRIDVDPAFVTVVKLCGSRGAPVHIVSDGFDYCIRRILTRGSLGLGPYLRGTRIVSSHLESDGTQWRASFTIPGQACAHGCATCKPSAMAQLNAAGAPTVFVGDGLSDRYAAVAADIVFAKHDLATYCHQRAIDCIPYENLATVAATLETFLESDTAVQRLFHGKAFPAR